MKQRHKSARPARLQFECLENRLPLAGNVTAALSAAGNLTIKGDIYENQIAIFDDGGGLIHVRGENGTKINGGAADFLIPAGGLNDVSANMFLAINRPADFRARGVFGADTVRINTPDLAGGTLNLTGKLSVSGLGAGVVDMQNTAVPGYTGFNFGIGISDAATKANSQITLQNGNILGFGANNVLSDVSITTSIGRDVIHTGGNTLARNLSINAGLGNDEVSLGFAGHDDVGGNLTVNGGLGNDQVTASDVFVAGSSSIDLGFGDDTLRIGDPQGNVNATFQGAATINLGGGSRDSVAILGLFTPNGPGSTSTTAFGANLNINGGTGADCVALAGVVVAQGLTVNTGIGNDFLGAFGLAVGGNLLVDSGLGDDIVSIGLDPNNAAAADPTLNFIGGATTLNTGLGNDRVLAVNTTFEGNVRIDTGIGNDKVAARDNAFNASVTADGGLGFDVGEFDPSNTVGGTFTPTRFESNALAEGFAAYQDGIIAKAKQCFPDLFP